MTNLSSSESDIASEILKTKENLLPFIGSDCVKHEPAEVSTEESKKGSKTFRINAKKLFLTYSRTNLTPPEVLAQLSTKFSSNIEKYVICQENHAEEPELGAHIHAFLEFPKKINISSPRKLDLFENNKPVHGEYQAAKNTQNVINYIKKDGNYITNFETEIEFRIKLFELSKKEGLSAAMNYFSSVKPELVCINYKKIESNLKAFLQNEPEKLVPKYENYNYPDDLIEWFNFERDEKTLFLSGPSGVGKTEGIINLLKDFNPILITDVNALKDLKPEHKAIIFDDIDWFNIPREVKIHLLNKTRSSSIKIIYQTVKLPNSLVKAVISNNPEDLVGDKAIMRRIRHVRINQPIFNQINQEITINVFN